jgi:hypothetical protein
MATRNPEGTMDTQTTDTTTTTTETAADIFAIMDDVREYAARFQGGVNCIETFSSSNQMFFTSGWGMRGRDEIVEARNAVGLYALEKYGRRVTILRRGVNRLWWTNLGDLRCGFQIVMTEDEHDATLRGAWCARRGN